eukprot:g25901.t1
MRCKPGEATKQDYLHTKQHKHIAHASLQPSQFSPCDIKKGTGYRKAYGNVTVIVLKICAADLATPLAKFFQYSYNTGSYLEIWKITQVCPVHKMQDKFNLVNCYHISLVSIISKVMEDVINSAMKQHLPSNNLLSDVQFEFCQGHSAPDLITPSKEPQQNWIHWESGANFLLAKVTPDTQDACGCWSTIHDSSETEAVHEQMQQDLDDIQDYTDKWL